MASEQTRARKKKSRSLNQEQPCPQILYRHQDCIPNSTLLHSCEQHRLLGLKNIQDGEFVNSLANSEEVNKQRTKKVNANPKNAKKLEKESQKLNIQPNISSEKSSEELSKSRKRRLRKRRLLTSLAPSLKPTNNHSLPAENTLQPKSALSNCPANSVLPVPPGLTNNDSDLNKTSPKNSRKRFEKSVGLRNKSIKSKTLVDNTNQSKSEIIKSIEEKTLNSLLQTLVPLTNSSPKKDKISTTPIFSFPEKRLSCGDSRVDKDDVFYFGETKDQLEKLTSHYNVNSEVAQSNQSNENRVSTNKLNISEDFISSLNISPLCSNSISNLATKPENINLSSLSIVENKRLFSFGLSDTRSKDLVCKSPTHEDLNHLPKDQPQSNQSPLCISLPTVIESKTPSEKTTTVVEHSTENNKHFCSNYSVQLAEKNITEKETKNNQSTMKSSDQTMKTNKTREEILLEREAKKAAKLAAKAKNKTVQGKKDVGNDFTKPNDSETVKSDSKGTNIEHTKTELKKESENVPVSSSTEFQRKLSHDHEVTTACFQPKEDSSRDEGKEESTKSKAELKAERRAKQEAQRAAKALAKTVQPQKETTQEKVTPKIKKETPKIPKIDSKPGQTDKKPEVIKSTSQPKPKLFSHLYHEKPLKQILKSGGLHPAIVRLGVQYATRVVVGSNARCIALLHALNQMIKDYSTPSEKEFSRGLEEELGPVTVYLNQCRPLAVSMTNALKYIKRSLIQLPNTIKDVEARKKIRDLVDTYIYEQIEKAGEAICDSVEEKIANGDVILTYGCSSLVCRILVESHLKGKKFRVIVVDGLPWQEGREMLRRLVEKGLSCTYVLITAASFIMREASKVLLGAHALLANGYVMSRAGSSQVALLAHCYNVPVLVCCETHKFSERVQTDAFVYNELGELCCDNTKDKNRVTANLTPLSLAYDITPPDLVSAVVTERAILPCTSVPVILRIKPSESVM